MQYPLLILAAGDDPTVKIIIGVVVAIFWLITQAAGAISKKPDKRLPPMPELPQAPRPMSTGRHPDLPGPRRGILTKTGLPKPAMRRPVQKRPVAMPPLPRQVTQAPTRPPVEAAPPVPRRAPVAATRATPAAPIHTSGTAGRATAASMGAVADVAPGSKSSNAQRPATLARGEFIGALLRPRNLRKAYVLTEILNPPLALRD